MAGKQPHESQDVQQFVAHSHLEDERRSHTPSLERSGIKKLAQQSTRQASSHAPEPRKYQTTLEDSFQTAPLKEKMQGDGLNTTTVMPPPPPPPPRHFEPRVHSDSTQLAPGKGRIIPAAADNNHGAVGTFALRKPVESIPSPETRPTLHKDLSDTKPSSRPDESGATAPPPAISARPPAGDVNLLAQIRARTSAATVSILANYITASCAGWC